MPEDPYIYCHQVGGYGGNHFAFIAGQGSPSGPIQRLELWTCKNHIGAVQVTFTNGFTRSAGKIHGSRAYQSKRFSAHERVESFTLWENFDGNRLDGIQIVTDKHTFIWGYSRRRPHESTNVGSGLLVGVVGNSRADIDRLGLVFLLILLP
jgi:hypothetical protein